VRENGVTRAAAKLNRVQSNVTARIRALEERLGTVLFERSSRGVVLTEAGERLLPYATRVGALLREAQEAARDDGTPRGQGRAGEQRVPAVVAGAHQHEHPRAVDTARLATEQVGGHGRHPCGGPRHERPLRQLRHGDALGGPHRRHVVRQTHAVSSLCRVRARGPPGWLSGSTGRSR
jgi:hypothetical protein